MRRDAAGNLIFERLESGDREAVGIFRGVVEANDYFRDRRDKVLGEREVAKALLDAGIGLGDEWKTSIPVEFAYERVKPLRERMDAFLEGSMGAFALRSNEVERLVPLLKSPLDFEEASGKYVEGPKSAQAKVLHEDIVALNDPA